jgi:hypothetical protein
MLNIHMPAKVFIVEYLSKNLIVNVIFPSVKPLSVSLSLGE